MAKTDELDNGLVKLTTSTPLMPARISTDVLLKFQGTSQGLVLLHTFRKEVLHYTMSNKMFNSHPSCTQGCFTFHKIYKDCYRSTACASWDHFLELWLKITIYVVIPHYPLLILKKMLNIFCCCNWLMSTSTATFTLTCLNILAVTSYQNF